MKYRQIIDYFNPKWTGDEESNSYLRSYDKKELEKEHTCLEKRVQRFRDGIAKLEFPIQYSLITMLYQGKLNIFNFDLDFLDYLNSTMINVPEKSTEACMIIDQISMDLMFDIKRMNYSSKNFLK